MVCGCTSKFGVRRLHGISMSLQAIAIVHTCTHADCTCCAHLHMLPQFLAWPVLSDDGPDEGGHKHKMERFMQQQ
jgi:hypothetical protein